MNTPTPSRAAVRTAAQSTENRRLGTRLLLLTTLLAVATLASGCTTGAKNPFQAGGGGGADRPVEIVVENDNWSDVALYVEVRGTLHRLGTVVTATQRRFKLPRALSGVDSYRFGARLLGGTYFWTPEFMLGPGSELRWQVGNSEATSHFSVRR